MEGDIHSGLAWLRDAVIYLGAVVIVAPICLRMRISPILGYLLAGVLIGPHALGLIHEVGAAAELAELGIVLLMFTIGLEISFQRLRRMAKQVFGVGMAQVLLTSAGFYLAARSMGLSNEASLLVGGALSLSSTAFVVRLLAERGALQSRQGRLVFSTLLFQDLAVAPMLAAAPLIAVADEAEMPGASEILLALGWALGCCRRHYWVRAVCDAPTVENDRRTEQSRSLRSREFVDRVGDGMGWRICWPFYGAWCFLSRNGTRWIWFQT